MTTLDGVQGFSGAKAALLCGGRLLCYQRDDSPGLAWPGLWDLPGGGREGQETPEACLLREVNEEFGLVLTADRLAYRRDWPSMTGAAPKGVFFAGFLTEAEVDAIHLGAEGQRWEMMFPQDFLNHPLAIPALKARLADALQALGIWGIESALGRDSSGSVPVAR